MPRIEGKTINELLRVEDITGAEIIPMSVFDEELSAYVTRGITLDNLFKTIYGMIQEAEANISYVKEDMTAYVDELRAYDNTLHNEDVRLDSELQKTNTYLAYHAEEIAHLHDHYCEITSYAYEGIGMLDERTKDIPGIAAYAYENVGNLWAANEELSAYAYTSAGTLEEMIVTSYESLEEAVKASYDKLDDSMQTSYEKLFDYISYVAAYAEGGTGELAYQVKELHAYSYDNIGMLWSSYDDLFSYTYTGIGRNSYVNLEQDIILAQHQNAISALARNISYESYVNTIQSGHINTIYYENSDDAFNDWSDPDDDNVKPQS